MFKVQYFYLIILFIVPIFQCSNAIIHRKYQIIHLQSYLFTYHINGNYNNKPFIREIFHSVTQNKKCRKPFLSLQQDNQQQCTICINHSYYSRVLIQKSILIKLILFMDKILQSRMNRSLLIHGLENLVFEKRQRKTIQTIPNTLSTISMEQKVGKKKLKTVLKSQPTRNNKTKNMKAKISKTSFKSKQAKSKKQKSAQQWQSESQESSIISEDSQKFEDEKLPENQTKKSSPLKLKGGVKVKKQRDNKMDENLKEEKQESNRQKQNLLGAANQTKRGRGRPKKDHSDINVVESEAIKVEMNIAMPELPIALPIEQIVPLQSSKPQKQPEKLSQQSKQLISSIEKVNTRQRRVKTTNYKNYNQNQNQFQSQQSLVDQNSFKKKKKIAKNSRSKNNNKPYNLNRIFRKEAKRHFATFSLDVDLNKISLAQFIKQFGSFDLIHFSLPISYLNTFCEMISLIEKGFIFVWAQKGETQIGYHLLNRWGFDVIDQIIWIKANEEENKIQADNVDICNSIGDSKSEAPKPSRQLFVNSKSTCLVGYKCPIGNKAEYRTKVSNNILFAKSLEGLEKPAEIYEIADLMMPGAKKLEFGNDAQKGWLNLKHHQNTIYRCNVCLREEDLYFLPNQDVKHVQCKRCIVNLIKNEQQVESAEDIVSKYQQLKKVAVSRTIYIDQDIALRCSICQKQYQCFKIQGLFQIQQGQYACIDCFRHIAKKQSIQRSIVLAKRRQMFLQSQLTCSDCGVLNICDLYFQCNKCRNHIICKNCFWKCKLQVDTNISIQEDAKKPSKKQIVHEWRLKFIKNSPLMKFICFGCKCELSIPFWCCETCQNWSWCGRCDKGSSEVHPHYQAQAHKEYIMI